MARYVYVGSKVYFEDKEKEYLERLDREREERAKERAKKHRDLSLETGEAQEAFDDLACFLRSVLRAATGENINSPTAAVVKPPLWQEILCCSGRRFSASHELLNGVEELLKKMEKMQNLYTSSNTMVKDGRVVATI